MELWLWITYGKLVATLIITGVILVLLGVDRTKVSKYLGRLSIALVGAGAIAALCRLVIWLWGL